MGFDISTAGTYYVTDVVLVDLTLMFGAGNEPSTVAEFEALFNKPYYAYNAGQIINNNVEAYETVGFNQWDEEWENGQYDQSTGEKISGDNVRNKNLIPVLPNTEYYLCGGGTSGSTLKGRVFEYDGAGKYLQNTGTPSRVFTTSGNTHYIAFHLSSTYGTTYNHDICINLSWSGYRNGEYEPYWKRSMKIDWKKLYGKLNGQGEMVQIAPNGGRSAGTVCDVADFVRKEADIKLVSLDMGSLDYRYVSDNAFFESSLTSYQEGALISDRYEFVGRLTGTGMSTVPNMSIANYNEKIRVKNTSYSDASTFKTAMNGVELVYALATPLHYTDLMMSDDGGQTFYDIPTSSKVADFGVEIAVPCEEVDASGVPKSAPLRAVIAYSTDFTRQLATMNKNYQSQESMDALLAALGTAMGGTWSKTWDSTNGKWTYSFTANSQSE